MIKKSKLLRFPEEAKDILKTSTERNTQLPMNWDNYTGQYVKLPIFTIHVPRMIKKSKLLRFMVEAIDILKRLMAKHTMANEQRTLHWAIC